ncbi:MAG: MBOAT family protein [Leptospiraceae bacterium]|nr:MBOAT family protein [Leptospiraceae bacterium]MCP5494705.1 MBOAT family protein [Leptospiraceae bacterium]
MLFTSLLFLLFFLIVYTVYWLVPWQKGKEVILLIASIIFYGSWSFPFLLHFMGIVILNYYVVESLLKNPSKKLFVSILVINFLNLAFFKYFYFFTDSFSYITGIPFFDYLQKSSFKIILPLAISFYTFQITAYTVDVYKRKATESVSLMDYMIFIMFFPQLIAGPIMRSNEFLPQLKAIKLKDEYITLGLSTIAMGILKKVLIADNIALIIDPIWNNPGAYSWSSLVMASYGFTWQVYCDFSGYTDLAIGTAYLLGFTIPNNFNAPYLGDSFRELWRRWHITLTTWLRDYIYIPMGGNKVSEAKGYFNMIVTFTIGGLWHGANWTFVIWGCYHGLALSIERFLENLNIRLTPNNVFGKLIRIFVTYNLFSLSVSLFRANNISDTSIVLLKFFTLGSGSGISDMEPLVYLCLFGFFLQLLEYFKKIPQIVIKLRYALIPLSYIVLLVLIGLYTKSGKQFVYFQF